MKFSQQFALKFATSWTCLAILWVIGVIVFGAISIKVNEAITIDDQENLDEINNKIAILLHESISGYINGLEGTRGVLAVLNANPTEEQYRKYAQSREYFKSFPGALGIGFIRYVEKNEIDKYLAEKNKVISSYNLKILNSNYSAQFPNHFVIELIEPYQSNSPARGLDVGSEPNRRDAAWLAARTGTPQITKSIQLVQANQKEPGFLIYLPYYKTLVTPENEIDRLKNLIGWAYAPLLLSHIITSIREKIPNKYDFKISEHSLHDTQLKNVSRSSKLHSLIGVQSLKETEVAGQKFVIQANGQKNVLQRLFLHVPILIFLSFCLLHANVLWTIRKLILKNLESELKVSAYQNWNRAVLNGSEYSIIATNTDGVINTFNKAAEKMLGYSTEELIGKQTPAIIHDVNEVVARAETLSKELGISVEPGFRTFVAKAELAGSDTNEWTYIRKDKTTFPVRLCVSCVRDDKNNVVGYLGIAEDISEQKKLLEVIETQRAKMASNAKMSALGEMAGGIAHEINNPLAIISGISERLKKIISTESFDKNSALMQIEKIENTSMRIAKIIKGLRTFSRNAENDAPVKCSLNQIVSDSLELCRERFNNHGVDIYLSLPDGVEISARPAQISQILMNLLNNSYDAICSLNTRWVKISAEIHDNYVHLAITDSGSGITEAVLNKIFDPFFTTKEVGKGTGLGLSISKSIAADHGGNLTYNSKSKNTQFILTLPISQGDTNADRHQAA